MADELPDDSFEHYQILRRPEDGSQWVLGRGNMGITYKAIDTRLQVTVALKIMNPECAENERSFKYFLREARAAAALNHRNIARVIHLSDKREKCFYAMEFIDGETIAELVHRQQRVSASEALPIVQQVARALTAAHDKQLVHRDIKPANIMLVNEVDETAVVKLIDFGLAKSFVKESNPLFFSLASGFTGTYEFASPEQISEEPLDCRSDIYSLGVTLWYMLEGISPFQGTQFSVSSQHLEAPPPFHRLPADVPPSVVELLARMLAKHRDNRPPTPVALRLEIKDILESFNQKSRTGVSTSADTIPPAGQTVIDPPVAAAKNGFHTQVMRAELLPELPDTPPPVPVAPGSVAIEQAADNDGRLFEGRLEHPADALEEAATVVGFARKPAVTATVERASLVPEAEIPADHSAVEAKVEIVPDGANPPPVVDPSAPENVVTNEAPALEQIGTSPPLSADTPAPEADHLEGSVFIDAPLPEVAEKPLELLDAPELVAIETGTFPGGPAREISPAIKPAAETRLPLPIAPEKMAQPFDEDSDFTAWLIVGILAVVLAIVVASVWWSVRPGRVRPRRPVTVVTPAPTVTAPAKADLVTPRSTVSAQPAVTPTPSAAAIATTPRTATKQRPFINSLGMKFVPLPGTRLLIGVHPTTRKNYAVFAQANRLEHREWEKPESDGVPVSQGEDHPVIMVSWDEAKEFCDWLSHAESGTTETAVIYRLPSVEEWRIARGKGEYPWGNEWPPPASAGNYADATAGAAFRGRPHRLAPLRGYNDGFATTSPVGSFPSNALGLHDIGGNVRQWCLNLDSRGSWQYMGSSWRDAGRSSLAAKNPGGQPPKSPRSTQLGFRCVLEMRSD